MRIAWILRLGVVLLLIAIASIAWNEYRRRKIDHDCWQVANTHSHFKKDKIVDHSLHMIVDHRKEGVYVDIYKECKRLNGLIK